MSKFTGGNPDSIADMLSDEDLMRSINGNINSNAQVIDMGSLNADEIETVLQRDAPTIDDIDFEKSRLS